jgi:hypothetical protein
MWVTIARAPPFPFSSIFTLTTICHVVQNSTLIPLMASATFSACTTTAAGPTASSLSTGCSSSSSPTSFPSSCPDTCLAWKVARRTCLSPMATVSSPWPCCLRDAYAWQIPTTCMRCNTTWTLLMLLINFEKRGVFSCGAKIHASVCSFVWHGVPTKMAV